MIKKLCEKLIKNNVSADICSISVFDSIDSTNSYGKNYILQGNPTPAMILAEEQTSGRGRCGRSFFSPEKTGLYMSILCKANKDYEDALIYTIAASVAASLAIEELSDKSVQIKWVNDIYIHGKKAGGILCESVSLDGEIGVVVGIGINVSTKHFPQFDNNTPTSTGSLDRNALAGKIYDKFMFYATPENRESCLFEYKKRFYLKDKKITIHRANGSLDYATTRGIDERGGLIAELADGRVEIIRSGEVTVRIS